jgi:hypothetical protein
VIVSKGVAMDHERRIEAVIYNVERVLDREIEAEDPV